MAKHTESFFVSLLLTAGIIAGPFYILVSVIEILFREGFDPTRHSWSLLSNGDLGWIHILTFIITGFLVLSFAVGTKHVFYGRSATWIPLLLGIYGLSLIAAGIFVADPMNGFPPGTPETPAMTTNGMLHLVSGMVGFLGFIAACLVLSRRFASLHEQNWSRFSLFTGIYFLVAFISIAAGSQPGNPFVIHVTLAFTAAVLLSWTWMTLLALKLKNLG